MEKLSIRYVGINDSVLHKIVELGDSNSKTLGHLPHEAYRTYAKSKGILILEDKERLLGYCLFRRQKRNNYIKIAQLCVNPKYRGQGVADKLLNQIKEDHSSFFRGIILNCRKDYVHASTVWQRNHFFPLKEKPGRGKDRSTLIQWLYNFNKIDLFNHTPTSMLKVLLDINILIKYREIHSNSKMNQDEEVKYLFNDDIITEVEYFHANESLNELLKDGNSQRRDNTRQLFGKFRKTQFVSEQFEEILEKIRKLAPPKNDNDISDRRQLSEAIANNIPYFITTDENLQKACSIVEDYYNINILTPSQFIIKFDQLQNSDTFLPRRLGGVPIDFRKIRSSEVSTVLDSFYEKGKRRKTEFKRYFNSLIARPESEVWVVAKGVKLIACVAFSIKESVIEVELVGIANMSVKYMLFSQIITEVIKIGVREKLNYVRVRHSDLNNEMVEILKEYRFNRADEYWIKTCLSGTFNSNALIREGFIKEIINRDIKIKVSEDLPNDQKYELERTIYPGKISDLEILNIVIPIKPYWASQLFDDILAGYSLFGSRETLVWNRKNVYYRSVRPDIEEYPCRILWYVSSSEKGKYGNRSKGIVACSYLEAVYIDTPKKLYSEFSKIGIYEWSNIYDLAKEDVQTKIKVIVFSDTEVFKKSIPLSSVQEILGKKHTFQSPVKIKPSDFFLVYECKEGSNE